MLALMLAALAGANCGEEPTFECSLDRSTKLFERRIEPLFLDERPSSCNQCHLAGIDLELFMRDPGRLFSRSQLVDKALRYDYEGMDRTVDVHIWNLRRKIEPDPKHPRYVRTVYGEGYKLGG